MPMSEDDDDLDKDLLGKQVNSELAGSNTNTDTFCIEKNVMLL